MDNIGRVDFDWFEISKNANRTAAELRRRNRQNTQHKLIAEPQQRNAGTAERPPRKNQLAPPLHKLRARRRGNSAERPDMIDWINSPRTRTQGDGHIPAVPRTWTTRSSSRTPLYSCWTYALKRRIAHFKEELVAASHREDRADSGLGRDIDDIDDYYFNRV
jgi:hypothetical protein